MSAMCPRSLSVAPGRVSVSRGERRLLKITDKREHLPGDKGASARRGRTHIRMNDEDGNTPTCSLEFWPGHDVTAWRAGPSPGAVALSPSCEVPLDTWAFLCPDSPVERDGPHPTLTQRPQPPTTTLPTLPWCPGYVTFGNRGRSQQVPPWREVSIRMRLRAIVERDFSRKGHVGALSF